MNLTAHFRGGPWDGRMLAVEKLPHMLRVPVMPLIEWWKPEPEAPLPVEALVYRRLPGVVAGEAIYELVA